jgi:hypothetical protein
MTVDLLQARRPFVARLAGIRVLVRAGDLYRANDALVGAFPDKFRAPKVHATGDSVGPHPATQPLPEPNVAAIKEFGELQLTTDADVVPLSEALAKLDEVTLASLYAEYEIEADTPEAALIALAATRYSEPESKPKAAPKRATRKKASASKSR